MPPPPWWGASQGTALYDMFSWHLRLRILNLLDNIWKLELTTLNIIIIIICTYTQWCSLQSQQDERFSFLSEWYDENAALIRKYTFFYYPSDHTIEMVSWIFMLGFIHADWFRTFLRCLGPFTPGDCKSDVVNNWVLLVFVELFTSSDVKHQRKFLHSLSQSLSLNRFLVWHDINEQGRLHVTLHIKSNLVNGIKTVSQTFMAFVTY